MNLLVFVDKEQISFFKEENSSVSKISDNYLYFYYNSLNKEIKYDLKYKMFVIEEKLGFFGDVLSRIINKSEVEIDGEKFDPELFVNYLIENEIKEDIFSKVYLSFSNIFNQDEITVISELFKSKFSSIILLENFCSLAVKNYLKSNQISTPQEDIFILSSNSENIISTNASFDGVNISMKSKNIIDEIQFYPYGYALAKKIYSDIKRIYQPKTNISEKENINFIYWRVKDKANEIERSKKPHVSISTRLKSAVERFVVNIKPDEVKVSAKLFLKIFVEKIINEAKVPKNARLILIGDLFENEIVYNGIDSSFKNVSRLEFSSIFETRNEEFTPVEDEFSTMFLSEDDLESNEDATNYKQASTLDLNTLQIGTQVKLTNYDARPGKGYSNQEVEYIGDNKFVVIESNRSLKTGDIAISETNVWHAGIKVIFKIQRNGKDYGRFQTREIQTIEVSE